MSLINTLVGPVTGLLDKFVEDKDQKAKLAHEIATMSDTHAQQALLAQLEINKAELLNSGKKAEMVEKISQGKMNKFISENTLLNQVWIMDPKLKVSDILKNCKVLNFIRYKVGEGV